MERCRDAPGGTDDPVRDLIEDIRSLGADFERALRRQTCVILAGLAGLAGLAAALAAAMTPVYLALFTGGA